MASADHVDVSKTCHVFDLFLDIPHPAASSSKERAEIVAPPVPEEKLRPEISSLYEPRSILQIERFAFPDFDSETGETYFPLFTVR